MSKDLSTGQSSPLPIVKVEVAALPPALEVADHQVVANESVPTKWGAIVFRGFLMQDLVGVLDPLQIVAHQQHLELSILAETLDPVTTEPASAAMNAYNSTWWPTIVPTHTFATAPEDLEVLIVPGGPGVRAPNVTAITNFIADRYPSLKYLITICTGAGLAAKSGVLDGRRATTNKAAWSTITSYGPNTTWISPARWVVDGNIWTSSGVCIAAAAKSTRRRLTRLTFSKQVTAGLDLVFAFIEFMWGAEMSEYVQGLEEYVPHAQDFDPFATKFNVTPTGSISSASGASPTADV